MAITLTITNDTIYKIPSTKKVKDAILVVLNKKKVTADVILGLQIVPKLEIKKLNRKFRQKNIPTDVLSFPIYEVTPKVVDHPILLGDIVLCYEVMAENAKLYGSDEEAEFLKLVAHSTLHLLGYHHKE